MADRSIKLNLTVDANGAVTGFTNARKGAEGLDKSLGKVGGRSAEISALSGKIGGLGVGLTAMAGLAVKKFADFDQAMSSVAATGDDARKSMDALRRAAIDAGADTVFSATEAANATEALAKAGVSAADILSGGLTGSLNLAAAGGLGVAEAAEIAATSMNQFGLKGADMSHIADLLAASAGKAMGDVTDMAGAFKFVGPVAAQMGISIEETAGSIAFLAQQGVLGEQAGTSLRGILSSLTSPSAIAAKEMENLGLQMYDASGQFIGLDGLAGQLQSTLGGLTNAERDQALGRIFGNEQITTARLLYSGGADAIREWTAAVDDQGYAAETAGVKMDNLKGDLESLGGSFETALINAGSGANDTLRSMVQGLDAVVDKFGELPSSVTNTTALLVGAGGLTTLAVAGAGKMVVGFNDVRGALKSMNVGMKTASIAAGGIGLAITAVTLGVSAWADASAEAKAYIDALKGSLDELGGVTEETRKAVIEGLGEKKGWWVFEERFSATDAAKVLGIELDTLADAAMGNEQAMQAVLDVTNKYNGDIGAQSAAADAAGLSLSQYGEAQMTVKDAVKGSSDSLEEAVQKKKDEIAALGDVTKESEKAAAGTDIFTGALEEQAQAADEAWAAIKGLADGMLGLRDTGRGYEAALDDATAALKENGKTLDITTEKGRANQAALDGVASAGWAHVDSLREQGASEDELQGAMKRTRTDFVKTATQMGMNKQEAKRLADELGLIPSSITTDVAIKQSGGSETYKYLQSIQDKIRAINGTKVRVAMGPGGQGGMTFSTGGGVAGPGTGTSDSIPAMLSNGEHVWTADDVAKAGGQGAMYRARGLVQAGLLRFAVGGAVGSAESSVDRERKAVAAARAAVQAAKKSKSDKDDKAAQKRLDAAEDRLDKARARLDRLRSERSEFSTDVRRGSIRDSVTSGLSGGLSVVDRALNLANSGDLSKKQSAALRKIAAEAEKSLTTQYGLLEKQNDKIEAQKSLLSDVKGLHDSTASSIMGQIRLTDALSEATTIQRTNVRGDIWHEKSGGGATPAGLRAYVSGKLAAATKFSGQLEALRRRGAPDALLQEVLSGGIEGGSALASALLSAGSGDWSAITGDWRALESVSSRIGDTATRSRFGTTAATEQKVLDAYTAGADGIKGAIDQLGAKLQTAIGKPLGYASGGWIAGGIRGKDSVPILGMPDEYIVNATSARANAGLLEAINATSGPVAAPMVAMPAAGYGTSSQSVTARIAPGDIARGMDGVALTLLVDGRPVRAIVRTEIGEQAASMAGGYV